LAVDIHGRFRVQKPMIMRLIIRRSSFLVSSEIFCTKSEEVSATSAIDASPIHSAFRVNLFTLTGGNDD